MGEGTGFVQRTGKSGERGEGGRLDAAQWGKERKGRDGGY